jgi:hypothetical protein
MKIGIDISEEKDDFYPEYGDTFKPLVGVYHEDLNYDLYSHDNLKFRVIVYIWYDDLALYKWKTQGSGSSYSLY